jgi:hypothetical protein
MSTNIPTKTPKIPLAEVKRAGAQVKDKVDQGLIRAGLPVKDDTGIRRGVAESWWEEPKFGQMVPWQALNSNASSTPADLVRLKAAKLAWDDSTTFSTPSRRQVHAAIDASVKELEQWDTDRDGALSAEEFDTSMAPVAGLDTLHGKLVSAIAELAGWNNHFPERDSPVDRWPGKEP